MSSAVLLARVSSKEQAQGFSLDAQKRLLLDYCARKGLDVARVFEFAESAKAHDRRQFRALLDYLRDSGERIVVVEKTDRLYRNFRDYVLIEELGLEIHLVKENEIISPNSNSHAKLVHGFKVLIAKNYLDNLSEETRKGLRERAASGWYPHRPPFGYKTAGEGREIIVEPAQAEIVRDIFARVAAGETLLSIAKSLNTSSAEAPAGRVWHKSRLGALVRSAFYVGRYEYQGTVYDGRHEPIVAEDIWHSAQASLDGKVRAPRVVGRQYALSRLLATPDGLLMTGQLSHGRPYYGAKAPSGRRYYIDERKVLADVADKLTEMAWPRALAPELREAFKEFSETTLKAHKADLRAHSAAGAKLAKRKATALENLLDGVISKADYEAARAQLDADEARITAKLDNAERALAAFLKTGEEIAEVLTEVPSIFAAADTAERASILRSIASRLTIHEDRRISIEFKPIFAFWTAQTPLNRAIEFAYKMGRRRDKSQPIEAIRPALAEAVEAFWEFWSAA